MTWHCRCWDNTSKRTCAVVIVRLNDPHCASLPDVVRPDEPCGRTAGIKDKRVLELVANLRRVLTAVRGRLRQPLADHNNANPSSPIDEELINRPRLRTIVSAATLVGKHVVSRVAVVSAVTKHWASMIEQNVIAKINTTKNSRCLDC